MPARVNLRSKRCIATSVPTKETKTKVKVTQASEKQEGGNHYKEFAIQPTEFIFRNNLGFIEGNVIKSVMRHRKKGGLQDLQKAKHYLELLMEYEYNTK
jgi:hypothetical protein